MGKIHWGNQRLNMWVNQEAIWTEYTFKIEAVRSSGPAACVVDKIEIVPKIYC